MAILFLAIIAWVNSPCNLLAQKTVDSKLSENRQRLNVLWIVSDDLSPELGCYGCDAVSTPHLDQLATSAIRCTNAFATAPICSTSRTALVTSIFQTTLGAHHHRTRNRKPLPDQVITVMEAFQNAGYFVCHQGKTDYNFQHDFKFDGVDWQNREPGQPFFAQIQIKQPHRTFETNTQPERIGKIKLPPQYPDHPLTRIDWANYLQSIETLDDKVGKIIERLQKEDLIENTAIFFFGDHGRPHVWDKQWLYDGGLKVPLIIKSPTRAARTDKQLISLIDLAPTSLGVAGVKVPASMTGRDFLAPNSEPRTEIFAARDRAGDALDRIRCIRTEEYKYIRNYHPELPYSTRSSYKNLQYPVLALMRVMQKQGSLSPAQSRWMLPQKPPEELYDLRDDPFETNNLANSEAHQSTLATLSKKLDHWEKETDDQGSTPEMSAAAMQKLISEKKQWYAKTMKKRGLKPDASAEAILQWWYQELNVPIEPPRK
ncbi:MAG: sulfatase [Planctomycetota bacterium]